MLNRGEVLPKGEPVESLSKALEYIDPRKGLCFYEAATGNLAFTLGQQHPWEIEAALSHLKEAQRLQASNRVSRKTLPGAQLSWMIALIYQKSGATGRAEALLQRARRTIYEKGYLQHYIRISLDLGEAYYRLGHWGRLRTLAEEILQFESAMSQDALSALNAWYEAVRHQNPDPSIWAKVIEKVRWGPPRAFAKVRPGQVTKNTRHFQGVEDDLVW